MSFYPDVPDILSQLKHDKDVHVAVASRTSAPKACVLPQTVETAIRQTRPLILC